MPRTPPPTQPKLLSVSDIALLPLLPLIRGLHRTRSRVPTVILGTFKLLSLLNPTKVHGWKGSNACTSTSSWSLRESHFRQVTYWPQQGESDDAKKDPIEFNRYMLRFNFNGGHKLDLKAACSSFAFVAYRCKNSNATFPCLDAPDTAADRFVAEHGLGDRERVRKPHWSFVP